MTEKSGARGKIERPKIVGLFLSSPYFQLQESLTTRVVLKMERMFPQMFRKHTIVARNDFGESAHDVTFFRGWCNKNVRDVYFVLYSTCKVVPLFMLLELQYLRRALNMVSQGIYMFS